MTASRLSCALCLSGAFLLATGCPDSSKVPSRSPDEPNDPDPGTPQSMEMRITGFATPESVLWDPRSDVYLVSNISGKPTERDDDGFISRVETDGSVTSLRWIDGKNEGIELNAPKGSCIVDDLFLVADIDQVRRFDRNNGTGKGSVVIPEAQLLNDLVCNDKGKAWVSDIMTGKILEIPDVRVDAIGGPIDAQGVNGLALDQDGRLWAVANSELFRIDEVGNRVDNQTLPGAALDGLVVLADGTVLVSSWEARAIFRGRPGEAFTPVYEDLDSPADFGYDAQRNRLLIPLFADDAVLLRELP
jgi:sugar lactone lactonase YvrE